VLNILCVTLFVTFFDVSEAAVYVKFNVYNNFMIENQKIENIEIKEIFT